MNIFWEIHSGLSQQGPGSNEETLKALSYISNISIKPNILDIGCGPGRQTIALAKYTKGMVTAVDNHQPFLDELKRRAESIGIVSHVITQNCSMNEMAFEEHSFDIIWSEGAIYIIGFEEGLKSWKRFVKPDGYIAVTEVSWLVDNPNNEILEYWDNAYPSMKTIEQNITIITNLGYKLINHFSLNESSWWNNYYNPLIDKLAILRQKYTDDMEAQGLIEEYDVEIEMYRKYSGSYGYVFYVMQS
jgi:ubiquinone/menaquinone biosynthesis C-methylase UbiE